MAAVGDFSRQFFVKSRLYLLFKMAANQYSLGHLSQVTPWFNPDLTICSKWLPLLKLYAQWSCSCGHQPPSLFTIRISRHAQTTCMHKRGTLIFVQQATFSEVPSFFVCNWAGLLNLNCFPAQSLWCILQRLMWRWTFLCRPWQQEFSYERPLQLFVSLLCTLDIGVKKV